MPESERTARYLRSVEISAALGAGAMDEEQRTAATADALRNWLDFTAQAALTKRIDQQTSPQAPRRIGLHAWTPPSRTSSPAALPS